MKQPQITKKLLDHVWQQMQQRKNSMISNDINRTEPEPLFLDDFLLLHVERTSEQMQFATDLRERATRKNIGR